MKETSFNEFPYGQVGNTIVVFVAIFNNNNNNNNNNKLTIIKITN